MVPAPAAVLPVEFAQELDTPYGDIDTAAFHRDGFLRLRGVLSPALVAWYRTLVEELVFARSADRKPLAERDPHGQAFLQVTQLWKDHPAVRTLTMSRRLASIVAACMGRRARLYHDQALYKEAGGGMTPLHTDWYYIPVGETPIVGLWMPLHAVGPEDGSLGYVPGSHTAMELRQVPGDLAGHDTLTAWAAARGKSLDLWSAEAGDLALHDIRIIHGTKPNTGGRARSIFNIFYLPEDARREVEPRTDFMRKYWEGTNWADVEPGALFAGPDRPVLYP